MDDGFDIKRVDYKSGCFIFGFDTFPILSLGEPQKRKRNGTLQAKVRALSNSLNVIMYMKVDNNIFVDKARDIEKDY